MRKQKVTLSLNGDAYAQAAPILRNLGLSVSTAVDVFLKAVIRTDGLPFDVSLAEPGGNEKSDTSKSGTKGE